MQDFMRDLRPEDAVCYPAVSPELLDQLDVEEHAACHIRLSDEEIVSNVLSLDNADLTPEDDDDSCVPVKKMTVGDALSAVGVLLTYYQQDTTSDAIDLQARITALLREQESLFVLIRASSRR